MSATIAHLCASKLVLTPSPDTLRVSKSQWVKEAELLCSHLRVLQEGLPPRGPRESVLRLWGRQQLSALSYGLSGWERQDGWSELAFGSCWFISSLWTARSADTHRDSRPRGMVQRVRPLNHCAFNRAAQTERRGWTRHLHSHGGKREMERKRQTALTSSGSVAESHVLTITHFKIERGSEKFEPDLVTNAGISQIFSSAWITLMKKVKISLFKEWSGLQTNIWAVAPVPLSSRDGGTSTWSGRAGGWGGFLIKGKGNKIAITLH